MLGYSRPLTTPTTRKEGLLNWVQMAINQIEADNPREAIFTLVDMLDTLSGKANPFAHVVDGISNAALDAALRSQHEEHRRQMAQAIAKAHAAGRAERSREILALLQKEA